MIPSNQEQLTLVNALILDCSIVQVRASNLAEQLRGSDEHDSQMRSKALTDFAEILTRAATRLRQEGLHPDSQGRIL